MTGDTARSGRASRKTWLLVSAAWVVPAVLSAVKTWAQSQLGDGRNALSWSFVIWESIDWLLYAFLTPFVFAMAERFPLRRGSLARLIPLHFAASLVLCAAWAGGGVVLGQLLLEGGMFTNPVDWFFTSLPFGVAVYFSVLGIAHGLSLLTQASRLSAQLAEARLGALRMQMHPHFLFNSLNAITVVMRDRDVPTAVRMMEQLGEMLHRVIRTDRPHEVPLRDELDFVRQYLALETLRFPDRLRPVFEIDPAVEGAAVPDLVLQPLVENALRHGLAQRSDATRVVIGARRDGRTLVLWVKDDGPGPGAGTESRAGVGLANTRERLATLYGSEGRLELAGNPEGGAMVTLRIPYRELVHGAT